MKRLVVIFTCFYLAISYLPAQTDTSGVRDSVSKDSSAPMVPDRQFEFHAQPDTNITDTPPPLKKPVGTDTFNAKPPEGLPGNDKIVPGPDTVVKKKYYDTLGASVIPDAAHYDSLFHISFSLRTACSNNRNELVWDKSVLDSVNKKPPRLYLHFTPFDTIYKGDTLKIIDSSVVYGKSYVWEIPAGHYLLSYYDRKNRRLFLSDRVEVAHCTAFDIPEFFNLNQIKVLKPKQSINVVKIDLTIFSAFGEEVFSTQDPTINWDGRNKTTGLRCEPGNYFYNCDVYEKKGARIEKRNITGVIELIY